MSDHRTDERPGLIAGTDQADTDGVMAGSMVRGFWRTISDCTPPLPAELREQLTRDFLAHSMGGDAEEETA